MLSAILCAPFAYKPFESVQSVFDIGDLTDADNCTGNRRRRGADVRLQLAGEDILQCQAQRRVNFAEAHGTGQNLIAGLDAV